MRLNSYTKSSAERKRYVIDYSDWLDTGETITDVVFAVTQTAPTNATPVTPLSIDAYTIPAPNTSVVFFASLGDLNGVYSVDVTISTLSGQVKEDTIQFTIKAA